MALCMKVRHLCLALTKYLAPVMQLHCMEHVGLHSYGALGHGALRVACAKYVIVDAHAVMLVESSSTSCLTRRSARSRCFTFCNHAGPSMDSALACPAVLDPV